MYKLSLKCKVITPIFMFGLESSTPELRPSEFKGMMRWWWRAIKAEDDIETLKKEEAKIFGGTEREQGKSKVKIRIKTKLEESGIFEYKPLPHHERNNCPIDYQVLCKKAFRLKAIKPDKELEIIFDLPSEDLRYLVYLMFILGGFGRRSRRGFGSIQICEAKIETNFNKTDKPQIEKIEITCDNILNFLKIFNNFYKKINDRKIINVNSAKGTYPWIREVILGKKGYHDKDELLKFIGYLSHKYSDLSLGSSKPRMASPVYVSVVKISETFYPIVTVLNFTPPSRDIGWNIKKQENFIKELVL